MGEICQILRQVRVLNKIFTKNGSKFINVTRVGVSFSPLAEFAGTIHMNYRFLASFTGKDIPISYFLLSQLKHRAPTLFFQHLLFHELQWQCLASSEVV